MSENEWEMDCLFSDGSPQNLPESAFAATGGGQTYVLKNVRNLVSLDTTRSNATLISQLSNPNGNEFVCMVCTKASESHGMTIVSDSSAKAHCNDQLHLKRYKAMLQRRLEFRANLREVSRMERELRRIGSPTFLEAKIFWYVFPLPGKKAVTLDHIQKSRIQWAKTERLVVLSWRCGRPLVSWNLPRLNNGWKTKENDMRRHQLILVVMENVIPYLKE